MDPNELEKKEELHLKESAEMADLVPSNPEKEDLPRLDAHYQLLEIIGQGGMGKVYRARKTGTRKEFAIKVLRPELTEDKVALKRFEQEVEATSKLTHPNLVTVYGHGTADDGSPYLVMDLLKGKSLAQLKSEGHKFTRTQIIELGSQLCRALQEAHQNGIIHRDLKPANILVTDEREEKLQVKVVDFGIARVANESVDFTQTYTHTTDVVGSPKYMSPEQCTGKPVDERSDIYSLGCIVYELLKGKPPFEGGNAIQIILKHLNEEAPPLRLDHGLNTVVANCLNKDPEDRYKSAENLARDLDSLNKGGNIKSLSRPKSLPKGNLLVIGLVFSTLISVGITLYQAKVSRPEAPSLVTPWKDTSDNAVAANMQDKAFEHFRSRSYSQAIPALKYVAETEKKNGDKFREGFAYQCIGQCYLSLGKYKEAAPWYQKSIKGLKGVPPRQKEGALTEAKSGYIEVLKQLGKDEEASQLLDELNTRSLRWLEKFYRDNNLSKDADRVRDQIKDKRNS